MTDKTRWYERDSRCIAAHQQPAILIDLCLSRGINSHRLLRGCGLFLEDVQRADTLISPAQFLALIANAERLLAAGYTFQFTELRAALDDLSSRL